MWLSRREKEGRSAGGEYETGPIPLHTQTNIGVSRMGLDIAIEAVEVNETHRLIRVRSQGCV